MLESIRHYAHNKLVEAGEAAQLHDRHAEYYADYMSEAEPHLLGPEMAPWLKRLRTEIDNLRAAIQWSLETKPEMVLRLLAPVAAGGGGILNTAETRRWLEEALECIKESPEKDIKFTASDLALQARAYYFLAAICFGLGDNAASRAAAEHSIALARQVGATRELASGLQFLSLAAAFSGDLETALSSAHEAIAVSRQNDHQWELSVSLSALSGIYTYTSGDLDQARSCAQEGLQIAQETGNPWLIGLNERSLARVAAKQGNIQEAQLYYEHSMKLFEEQGNQAFVIVTRSDLGHFLRKQGEYQAARNIYQQTIREWFEHGSRPAIAHQLECFAYIASAQDEPIRAAKLLGTAESLRAASNSFRMGEEQQEYEQAVAQLLEQLDERDFQAALNAGRLMNIEQAIAFALAENEKEGSHAH
jgi:tetratricopeptide (TPR) repeat protein